MSLTQTVAPSVEPITVAQLKKHLRLNASDTAVNFTDLASVDPWTTVTSATGGFTGMTDEELVITSGTNFTPGRYNINSVTDDNTAVLASACGSGGAASSGVGYIPTDDTTLETIITVARLQAENFTGRAFITQTWVLRLDAFPSGSIYLPMPTLQSVTSVQYVDTSGTTQTLTVTDDYTVDIYHIPGRISEAYGTVWPTTRTVDNAVTITFVAGYGDAASNVPDTVKQGILMWAGTLYESRESDGALPNLMTVVELAGAVAAKQLLGPHKCWWF